MFDHLAAEPVYNTGAVVQRTGVPADTFRAWERRYGIPRPHRTPGNHRLYSDRDIATISWLRDQTRSGVTISQSIALFRSTASRSATLRYGDHEPGRHEDPLARFRHEIAAALLAYDGGRADRLLVEALALGSVEDLGVQVLEPILEDLGERCERGEPSVGAGHFAAGYIARKLGSLFNLSSPDLGRGPVLAACLDGELHEIGLLILSLFLSRRGYRVVYLGANLPLGGLIEAAERLQPRVVLLSTSTRSGAERLIAAVAEVERRLRATTHREAGYPGSAAVRPIVGYGGLVYRMLPELLERTTGVFFGSSASEAVDRIDELMTSRS